MTRESRVALRWTTAVFAAAGLLLTGAGSMYLLMNTAANPPAAPAATRRPADDVPRAGRPSASEGPVIGGTSPLPDVEIPLGVEAAKRAGIVVTPVAAASSSSTIRLPGVVTPNAYRQVTVTPLVSGRVTAVNAQLGDRVRRGQTIARIYSPELADAQTRYVSAAAMLQAHERELQRTQKLVDIGAASRQELEKIHAEHAAQTASVQSARVQLELLGVPSSRLEEAGGRKLNATTEVPAPIDGVVTERSANVGLNVDAATKLFTVVDLSTVWVVADIHERDMSRVRVGTEASITSDALADTARRGRVSYIDPRITAETRTAKARIELPNPSGDLRLDMYVDVVVTTGETGSAAPGSTAPESTAMLPRSAVQNIGDRTVVYLADPTAPGRFIEREVHLAPSSGELAEVTSGIRPGDRVVTAGSFALRAERERLGLRSSASGRETPLREPGAAKVPSRSDVQTARVTVTEQGFEPAKITLNAGTPAKITFVRTSDKTCATEVVFPSLNLKRALPLNKEVAVDFTPSTAGELTFACGMNMLSGVVVVQ